MTKSIVAVTALAGSLLFLPLAQGSATPAGTPGLKSVIQTTPGAVELVKGGGGGGGGGGGHGGGGFAAGGGGGGGHGGGGFAAGGGGGGGHGGGWGGGGGHPGFAAGGGHMSVHMSGRSFAGTPRGDFDHGPSHAYSGTARVYAGRSFDRSGPSNGPSFRHGRSIAMNNDHANWNGDWNHHHFDHHHRFNNVFIYGGNYGSYAYNDCYWLRRQAQITGSPYWWSRYEACVGYGY